MRLNAEQTDALVHVEKARRRVEQAREDALRAALDAVNLGVPQSRVADAYGISRMSMWRLLTNESARDVAASGRVTHQEDRPDEQIGV